MNSDLPSRARVSWIMLALLTACAAALRIIRLDSDLWLDEIATVTSYLRHPFPEIVRTYYSANQHLLYSLLGRASILLFGESAWAVRLPAVLFGIAGVPAVYYMARAIASETEALLASAFLAFSYHHVWFSQDARGYSAMVFFCTLGTAFLFRALRCKKRVYWIAYVLAMTLGVVALLNTLFVVLGHLAAFLLLYVWARIARRTPALPLRPVLISSFAIGALSLLCHGWMLKPMLRFYLTADRTALGFSLAEFIPVAAGGLVLGVGAAGLIAIALLMLGGWYDYWRQTKLVGAILVLPAVLNVAALVILKIGAYPRSFLYVLPFVLVIAVRGIVKWSEWLRVPRLAPAIAIGVIALTAIPLLRYYRYPKQDYTGAMRFVREQKQPEDIIAAIDLAGASYRDYYAPGVIVPKSVAEIEALHAGGRRVWVLYSFPRELSYRAPDLFTYVRTRLRSRAVFPGTLGGGDLYVATTP